MIFRISLLMIMLFSPAIAGAEQHFPFLGEIVSDKVNIRAGQDVNFEKIDTLNKGDEVVVLESHFSWYKIQLRPTAKAYARVDYFQMVEGQIAEVTGNNVNIRAGRGVNFASLGQLKKGTYVKILEKFDDWFRIEPMEGLSGWVHQDFVKFKSDQVPAPQTYGITKITPETVEQMKAAAALPPVVPVNVRGRVAEYSQDAGDGKIYRITGEDGKVMDLEIDPLLIKPFLDNLIDLQGELKDVPASPAAHSVVVVKKFNLIL